MRLIFWECGNEDKKMSGAEEKYSRVRGWGRACSYLLFYVGVLTKFSEKATLNTELKRCGQRDGFGGQ